MPTIKLRRSSTPGAIPASGSLGVGELAVNTADARLYVGHSDGTAKPVAGAGASVLSELHDVAKNSPTTGQLLKYSGSQWTPSNVTYRLSELTDVDLTTTPPVAGQLLRYTSNGWVPSRLKESTSSISMSNANTSISLDGASTELINTTATPAAFSGLRAGSNAQVWFNSGGSYASGSFKVLGGAAGTLYLYVNATATNINGHLLPTSDNTRDLGSATMRMRQLYAGATAISTSDEREKQDIEAIPEEWLRAWGEVQFVRFRFQDAVALKGDGARWHTGVIAQRVRDAFLRWGIDPFAIGLLCHDDIGDGQDRYGIRYEEALTLECAYLRWQLQRISH